MASRTQTATLVALGSSLVYTAAVLYWAVTTGIHFGGQPGVRVWSLVYAASGPFLLAFVPVWALWRFTLVTPTLVSAWFLGTTIHARLFLARPHDALASYLTVWPLILGVVLVATVVEAACRSGLDRWFDRFGPRTLR